MGVYGKTVESDIGDFTFLGGDSRLVSRRWRLRILSTFRIFTLSTCVPICRSDSTDGAPWASIESGNLHNESCTLSKLFKGVGE